MIRRRLLGVLGALTVAASLGAQSKSERRGREAGAGYVLCQRVYRRVLLQGLLLAV